jgi:hypothetical protein
MADPTVSELKSVFKKRTRRKNVPPYCEIPGCGRKYWAKGLCKQHYWRLYAGKDPTHRTRFDKNEIVVKGDIAEIVLYDRHGNEIQRAIIDTADAQKVMNQKWCCTRSGKSKTIYVINSSTGTHLHNVIMPAPKGMIIDHKDGDGLNNRRYNLRPATHANNMQNAKFDKGTSKFKGVHFYKQTKKWRASIAEKHLGYFNDEHEAARAYDNAAKEMFGEFARLNLP